MKKNLLFICGSLNQTTMMHKIAMHLPEYHTYFTPFYADGLLGFLSKKIIINYKGSEWFENKYRPIVGKIAIAALLITLIVLFGLNQGHNLYKC